MAGVGAASGMLKGQDSLPGIWLSQGAGRLRRGQRAGPGSQGGGLVSSPFCLMRSLLLALEFVQSAELEGSLNTWCPGILRDFLSFMKDAKYSRDSVSTPEPPF